MKNIRSILLVITALIFASLACGSVDLSNFVRTGLLLRSSNGPEFIFLAFWSV